MIKFQISINYDVIVDQNLGKLEVIRIANSYPLIFKICTKMLFAALILIVSMKFDKFQILAHNEIIID